MIRTFLINDQREIVCGGWDETKEDLDDNLRAIFSKATSLYTPVKLIGRQIVAGVNYRFEALDQNNQKVIITIFEDLDGNCSITNIN